MVAKVASSAGTLESGDVLVRIEPMPGAGIVLELESVVKRQFGDQIQKVAADTLRKVDMTDVLVSLNDRGALDPIIEARVLAAACRAAQSKEFKWEG